MKPLFHLLLSALILCARVGCAQQPAPSASPSQSAGRDIELSVVPDRLHVFAEGLIRDVVVKIKSSEEGHFLLDNAPTPSMIVFSRPEGDGWMVRWHLAKGTAVVPAPKHLAITKMEVVTDKSGIILELFIASKTGDMLEESTREFTISKNPRMVIGYYIQTHDENPLLKKRIEKLIDQLITDTIKAGVVNSKTK
jgi:hypothetical protein